jgi:hypothetical protein
MGQNPGFLVFTDREGEVGCRVNKVGYQWSHDDEDMIKDNVSTT